MAGSISDAVSGSPSALTSASGDSTSERVSASLRRRILTGELRPGTPLRELALSREYGISRNTFREVIQLLAFDRLVQHSPNRGAAVARLSRADAHDIYEARRVLETAAVERAVICRPADLGKLGAALAALDLAAHERGWERLVEADLEFHCSLVALLGSDRMSGWFGTITSQLRLAFAIVACVDREIADPEPLVEEHKTLFDAIVHRDTPLATRLIAEHLDKYETRCMAILGESDPPDGPETGPQA